MKKIVLLIAVIAIAFGVYYYYNVNNDTKLLKKFANEIINDSIVIDSVIKNNVKYTEKGKKLSLYVLNFIKEEYKKNKGQINIYTPEDAKKYRQDKIVLKDKERLYYIKFNNEMIWPFIANNESKIVVLLILTKGKEVPLSESRSDE